MNPDQLVSARDVLRAIEEVRRVGVDRLLREWERREPDLAEHVLEGLSELHRHVAALAPPAKVERRLVRRAEILILVSIIALRHAFLRGWQEDAPVADDHPLTGDPQVGADPPGDEEGGDPDGP